MMKVFRFGSLLVVLALVGIFLSCGKNGDSEVYTIGVMRFASSIHGDNAFRGVTDALTEAGYIHDQKVGDQKYRITFTDAQNDYGTAQSIAQKYVTDDVDLIITFTTPCLQVTAMCNETIPHVFGMVTDPFRMGIAEDPEHHQANVTGIATLQPVDETIELVTQVLPEAKTIGVIWNPTEACSEACTEIMRQGVEARNLSLVEITVTSTNEVLTAAQGLIAKDVDLIFVSGDNTVSVAIDAVVSVGDSNGIPVVSNDPENVAGGTLFSLGADYYTVGKETGKLAVRVIKGEKPVDIPIQKLVPKKLWINRDVGNRLSVVFPEAVVQEADKIIG